MAKSPVVAILKDINSKDLAVSPNVAIPSGTPGVMLAAKDANSYAQYLQLSPAGCLKTAFGANEYAVHSNATITSSSSIILTGYGASCINLFINIKNAPTGTSPTLVFTISEVDPGDNTTVLGQAATSSTFNSATTQRIHIPYAYSGHIKVAWTIGGTDTPSFTGVYATLSAKESNYISQDVLQSSSNNYSGTGILTAGSTWSGTVETSLGIAGIQVNAIADKDGTVTVYQSMDSSNWDISDSFTTYAGVGASQTVQATASYLKVSFTNRDTASTSYIRLQTALCPVVEALPRSLDTNGNLKVSVYPIGIASSGFVAGYVSTTTTTAAVVKATTYTEQTTAGVTRSIASSSTDDVNTSGTGAWSVKITYLTTALAGYKTVTYNLNGTTAVNTTETDICFIEKMEIVTAGSGGTNAGVVALYTAADKGGSIFASIAVNDNQTFYAHHYVPVGKIAAITGFSCCHTLAASGSGGMFQIKKKNVLTANSVEIAASGFIRLFGTAGLTFRDYETPIRVQGPSKFRVWVTPETTSDCIYYCAVDYVDQ